MEDVRAAAPNAEPVSDAMILAELDSMERVYPRRSRNGPRSWAWFVATIGSRFDAARQTREARQLPPIAPASSAEEISPDFLSWKDD